MAICNTCVWKSAETCKTCTLRPISGEVKGMTLDGEVVRVVIKLRK